MLKRYPHFHCPSLSSISQRQSFWLWRLYRGHYWHRPVIRPNKLHVNNYSEDNAAKVISTTPWLLTLSTLSNTCSPHICGTQKVPAFQSFGCTRVPSLVRIYLTDQSFQFRFVIRTNELHVDNNFDDRAAKFISATPLLLTLSMLRNKCSLHIFGIGYSKGTHFLSARESFGLTTVPTFWPIRRSD